MKKVVLSVLLILCVFSAFASGSTFESSNVKEIDFIKKAYKEVCYGEFVFDAYTDEFGDKTDEYYIGIDCVGTFSNNIAFNNKLNAVLLIDKDAIRIALYEYGHNRVFSAPTSFDNEKAVVKIKYDNGKILSLDSYCNGKSIQIKDAGILIDAIYNNSHVKFSITVDNNHYNFTLNTYGFAKVYTDTFLID